MAASGPGDTADADVLFEILTKPTMTEDECCEALKDIKHFIESRHEEHKSLLRSNMERFIPIVAQYLAHRNLTIFELSNAILEKTYSLIPAVFFSETNVNALRLLLEPSIAKSFGGSTASSETVRVRVYELLFRIGSLSNEALIAIDQSNLLNGFFEELNAAISDSAQCDVLVALNYIQVLGEFATLQHGITYLDSPQRQIFNKLDSLLRLTLNDTDRSSVPLLSFFWPALLKFFASVARTNCNWLFNRPSYFWSSLKVAVLEPVDVAARLIAIESIGWIFELPVNKLLIERYWRNDFALCVTEMHRILAGRSANADREVRTRVAECFSRLLDTNNAVYTQLPESKRVVNDWLIVLFGGAEFLSAIFEIIRRQPSTDRLRPALFGTMCAVARTSDGLGIRLIRDCAGLLEYLIDRSTEAGSDADAKRAKFDVVAAIVQDREALMRTFDGPVVVKLSQFVAEGPFFAQPESRVDLEAPS